MPRAEHRSPVAQLAEHPAVNRRVVGSSPTRGVGHGGNPVSPMSPLVGFHSSSTGEAGAAALQGGRYSSCRCFQKTQHSPASATMGTTIEARMTTATAPSPAATTRLDTLTLEG